MTVDYFSYYVDVAVPQPVEVDVAVPQPVKADIEHKYHGVHYDLDIEMSQE